MFFLVFFAITLHVFRFGIVDQTKDIWRSHLGFGEPTYPTFSWVMCLMYASTLQLYQEVSPTAFYAAFSHKVKPEHRKMPRSLLEMSGEYQTWPTNEDTAVLVWEPPVSQERGVMRPLTHDSVCLVSDTERQPTRDGKRKKKEEREEKEEEGWDTSRWVKDWWKSREIKVRTKTDPIKKEQYQEDIGRTLLLLECSNTLQAPQHMISLDCFHNKWKSDCTS